MSEDLAPDTSVLQQMAPTIRLVLVLVLFQEAD
jgi:hypothetical protein